MNTLNEVLSLEPEKFDAHWGEIDGIIFRLDNALEQIDAWEKVLLILKPTDLSKGHPYFRLGVLRLRVDPDHAGAVSFLEKAYAEDKRFQDSTGTPAHRRAAYRLLSLVKGFFQYLQSLSPGNWQLEQLIPPHRPVMVETLLTLYDETRLHVLDMKSYTHQEFFSLIERPELARFAIQNYFCAQDLLTLFFLENPPIDRNTDEYPLSRAIVGLFGGVIEAILASRLTVGSKTTLGGFINEGRETGLIRVGTKLAALCTLILYLRNHVHAERAASQTEFFIDINVAKGCKVALDWAISELLQQSAVPNTVAGPQGPAAHPEPVGPHGATGPGPPPSGADNEAK